MFSIVDMKCKNDTIVLYFSKQISINNVMSFLTNTINSENVNDNPFSCYDRIVE